MTDETKKVDLFDHEGYPCGEVGTAGPAVFVRLEDYTRMKSERDAALDAVRDFGRSTEWMQTLFEIADEAGELGFWPDKEPILFQKIVEVRENHAATIALAGRKT